jgi:hypothetical protein
VDLGVAAVMAVWRAASAAAEPFHDGDYPPADRARNQDTDQTASRPSNGCAQYRDGDEDPSITCFLRPETSGAQRPHSQAVLALARQRLTVFWPIIRDETTDTPILLKAARRNH